MKKHLSPFYLQSFPFWFKALNGIVLLPSLAWPLVTLFLFLFADNPTDDWLRDCIIIVAYPLYLIVISALSFKAFQIYKILGISIPLVMIGLYSVLLLKFFNQLN
ncbi:MULTISPECIES: hypothetical protein [unclassified Siphonobacter]|uniref:hypothetical protein n=1 Tax=unclassified Siphonobacter TaxID=2635712 RepID=UPI00278090F6|nr:MULTISPECIES: hypothetical protein [unclassified Siphonobacter]MDQ1086686.1 hypothetical protein [Siphonobacter sp. SORGH_AS_1065]MDR6196947.1 hypothetical protein [Siphonobacter sp. SORGH_AS_0500]